MKNYEIWLRKYSTFINDLEEILNDKDWREQLNEIAEDVSLAYDYRKALEKAPKKIQDEIYEYNNIRISLKVK